MSGNSWLSALHTAPMVTASPDHERRPARYDILELDLLDLARLAHLVGGGGRPGRGVRLAQERAAALAVIGARIVDGAALWTVLGHRSAATRRRMRGPA